MQEEIKEQKRKARQMRKLKSNLTTGGILLGVLLLAIIFIPKLFSAMEQQQKQLLAETQNKDSGEKGGTTKIIYEDRTPEHKKKPKEVLPQKFPIYIQSYPTGATIEIDGEVIGTTPLEISGL